MFPILYENTEREFTTNGLGVLSDCSNCTVTEERNGIFELEMKYPITGRFYKQMIETGGIIGAIHNDQKTIQPFDIYGYSAPIDGVVTFYAHHISYRLNRVILKPFTAGSCADVMSKIVPNSYNNNPFTFWTDKATAAQFSFAVPQNVRAILSGQEGSVLDVYGTGDYEFDKWSVKLYADRGADNGVTIRYGKNLSDIVVNDDKSGSYNAIAPYWRGIDGEVVYLPELYVVSPDATGALTAPWTDENNVEITDDNGTQIDFTYITQTPVPIDFSESFEEAPTVDELRAEAYAYLSNNQPWNPKHNIKVDFLQLWQTPEYENVASLQRVSLCDYVSVYYPELDVIAAHQKVIRVVYNVLLERYDEMELGTPQVTLQETIYDGVILETKKQIKDFGSVIQAAIDYATEMITGGLGGYVVFKYNADDQPEELLIMDTNNTSTAVNVIRMNKNGIGFSTNGYNGPFQTAWTIDGHFNADFITAGELNAAIIKAGILSDLAGKYSFDLLTGNVVMNDATLNNANLTGTMSTYGTDTYGYIMSKVDSGSLMIYGSTNGSTYSAIGSFVTICLSNGRYNARLRGNGAKYLILSGNGNASGEITIAANTTDTNTDFGYPCLLHFKGISYFQNNVKVAGNLTAGTIKDISSLEFYKNGAATVPEWIYAVRSSRDAIVAQNADIYTYGNLGCAGTKSRIVETKDYGTRELYCYETPSPLFGDIGEGIVGEDGKCYVWLDPVFSETIRTQNYQVFLQAYGDGNLYISNRTSEYFIVIGNPGIAFGWEIKAKQADFAERRLEKYFGDSDYNGTDYGTNALNHIMNLKEGRTL